MYTRICRALTSIQCTAVLFVGIRENGRLYQGRYQRSSSNTRRQVCSNRSTGAAQNLRVLLTHHQGTGSEHAAARRHSGKGRQNPVSFAVDCTDSFFSFANLLLICENSDIRVADRPVVLGFYYEVHNSPRTNSTIPHPPRTHTAPVYQI